MPVTVQGEVACGSQGKPDFFTKTKATASHQPGEN